MAEHTAIRHAVQNEVVDEALPEAADERVAAEPVIDRNARAHSHAVSGFFGHSLALDLMEPICWK